MDPCPSDQFEYHVNNLCIFKNNTFYSALIGFFNFLMMLVAIKLFKRTYQKIESITKPGIADPPDKTYCILTLQMVKVVQLMLIIIAID